MSKEVNWQEECLKKGFEYVREPDDHYVIAAPAEMVAMLRDLLGVDVRTKDGDDYGIAVSDLQEQVDGLVNTLHAQQAERDALLAERDRLAAENERLARDAKNDTIAYRAVIERQEELRAEVEALKKDAERYRWLRNPDQDVSLVLDKVTGEIPVDKFGCGGYRTYEYRAGEELDTAIDAALQGEQP